MIKITKIKLKMENGILLSMLLMYNFAFISNAISLKIKLVELV